MNSVTDSLTIYEEEIREAGTRIAGLSQSSEEELENDLEMVDLYNKRSESGFEHIFTSCIDKIILIRFYSLLSKYQVKGATPEAEDALHEVKWDTKKLKLFDGLGD